LIQGKQARSQTGFDVSTFVIDWEQQVVQCPQGHLSRLWRHAYDSNRNPLIEVVFDRCYQFKSFFASSNHIAKAQTRHSALAALHFQLP
jgi:hypothetical protein